MIWYGTLWYGIVWYVMICYGMVGGTSAQPDRLTDPDVPVQPRHGLLADDVERRPSLVPLRAVHHRGLFRDHSG